MKKIILGLAGLALVFSLIGSVGAINTSKKNQKQKFSLPENAVEVSHGIFYLGESMVKGKIVEGYAFMAYNEDTKKAKKVKSADNCYKFLAKGAKWRNTEDYIVNPANTSGLDSGFVVSNLADDIIKWEDEAGISDIFGAGESTTETLVADTVTPDERNEVYFANIDPDGVIAIAIVWGIYRGPLSDRELIEWDMVFNDENFDWSSSGEIDKMDFENIATHELGHAAGMGDLYNRPCAEQTMYGYSTEGEIKKRTLELGDIAGIQELYGN